MLNALFYKEWIKTRRIIFLLGVVLASLLIYTFIHTGQLFRVGGAVQVWVNIITKDFPLLPEFVRWFPLMAGLLLGLVQFIPEMTDKRLKLTLHLPLPETKILSSMLLYGMLILLAVLVVFYAVLYIGLSCYYPSEILAATTWQMLPWLIGGLLSYFFAAWVCLEPVWRQRVLNALIAIAGLSMYYMSAKSGGYIYFVPCLLLVLVAGFSFPFYSAARFKDGAQR
ncbi:hypothetical protein [Dysgonomonas sp. 25]|uniref:hypothetical protein n=1 Tax=Dysgonomonas sp. 25 TaxID=2302933 RepID=UPI0013D259CE|nr:hypothetical protein [Dysgonomonas sp. 25]NDV68499.1 hypothetical protein [Dysgonomonas sp. 25]